MCILSPFFNILFPNKYKYFDIFSSEIETNYARSSKSLSLKYHPYISLYSWNLMNAHIFTMMISKKVKRPTARPSNTTSRAIDIAFLACASPRQSMEQARTRGRRLVLLRQRNTSDDLAYRATRVYITITTARSCETADNPFYYRETSGSCYDRWQSTPCAYVKHDNAGQSVLENQRLRVASRLTARDRRNVNACSLSESNDKGWWSPAFGRHEQMMWVRWTKSLSKCIFEYQFKEISQKILYHRDILIFL